jgi:F-box protein 11
VLEKGAGTIEDCEIYGNESVGIGITTGGVPRVRNCRIHDGRDAGIVVYENGAGTIEDCEIVFNAEGGVQVIAGGNPLFRRCAVRQNKGNGFWVHHEGVATAETCIVKGNGLLQWVMAEGCILTVDGEPCVTDDLGNLVRGWRKLFR